MKHHTTRILHACEKNNWNISKQKKHNSQKLINKQNAKNSEKPHCSSLPLVVSTCKVALSCASDSSCRSMTPEKPRKVMNRATTNTSASDHLLLFRAKNSLTRFIGLPNASQALAMSLSSGKITLNITTNTATKAS